jgi:hypothetical protein
MKSMGNVSLDYQAWTQWDKACPGGDNNCWQGMSLSLVLFEKFADRLHCVTAWDSLIARDRNQTPYPALNTKMELLSG